MVNRLELYAVVETKHFIDLVYHIQLLIEKSVLLTVEHRCAKPPR